MQKSNVFNNTNEVKCVICGKNLIDDISNSMLNIIHKIDTDKIVSVKPCCKGNCDKDIKSQLNDDEISKWQEFSYFTNPYLYIDNFIAAMDLLFKNKGFDNKEAFDSYKELLLNMYPYVSRNLTAKEINSAKSHNMFPF